MYKVTVMWNHIYVHYSNYDRFSKEMVASCMYLHVQFSDQASNSEHDGQHKMWEIY